MAIAGIFFIPLGRREASPEDHLRAYYAAERGRDTLRGIGKPTLRSKLAQRWYKLRKKDEVHFLNRMAKHHSALEDLGYLETRTFVLSNRPALYVQSKVWDKAKTAGQTHVVNGLVNLWTSAGTNRVYVMAPKANMPQWETWIREADVPENR